MGDTSQKLGNLELTKQPEGSSPDWRASFPSDAGLDPFFQAAVLVWVFVASLPSIQADTAFTAYPERKEPVDLVSFGGFLKLLGIVYPPA